MSLAIPEQSQQAKILDPRASQLVADDGRLTTIPLGTLDRAFIHAALCNWQNVQPMSHGDGNKFAGRNIRSAAVLIGLVQRDYGIHVVLTQRASHLRDHAGQIAFAGGAMDASDRDAWHTATREAWEEVGLQTSYVVYLGRCHTYTTVTAFEVTPCVGWIDPNAAFKLATNEVSQVFEVSLAFLMSPANHQLRSVMTPVGERRFYAIPCADSTGTERFVWGATAAMLRNLYALLAAELTLEKS